MQAEIGITYSFFVHGEPVAKTTQKPPRTAGSPYELVMRSKQYSRLARTWEYQALVAQCAMVGRIPTFSADDPICLILDIRKGKHKTGDTKNIMAAIEDGLVFGKFIPDDRQVTDSANKVSFGWGNEAGVLVNIGIDERAIDEDWMSGYLQSRKKAKAYIERVRAGGYLTQDERVAKVVECFENVVVDIKGGLGDV